MSIMLHPMHSEGEWMLSYSYMGMDMEGIRDGTDSVPTPSAGYMVTPTSMSMYMHMF